MKKFLDVVLLILFFAELSSNFMPAQIHEAGGIVFMLLIVAHNVLNRNFYRAGFSRRRAASYVTIILFAGGVLALAVSGAALADYFTAPNVNWRAIHLGAAIFSTVALFVHILIHARRYVRGKIFYAASGLAFILAFAAIFGLPYVDRWFHRVEVNRTELARGEKISTDGKVLIVYFSRVGNTNFPAEVDAVSGASLMVDGEEIIGNAQMIAELVQSVTDGEIFALQTEKTYPADYSQTTQVAKQEFAAAELPKLKSLPDVATYDKLVLIYPLWWGDLPKPVESFLHSCDLRGKKVLPIVTHGGGGLGSSIDTLKNSTQAEVCAPLDIYSSDIPASRKVIRNCLKIFRDGVE